MQKIHKYLNPSASIENFKSLTIMDGRLGIPI